MKLLIFFIIFSFTCYSQTTVPTYSYDQAGNRVLRQMLLLGGRAENPSGSKMAKQTVSEEFNGVVISAFPNPSKGEITIEFPKELLENGLVEFQLLGADGSVLKTGSFSETRNPLDISTPGVGYSALTWGASLAGWGFLNFGKWNNGFDGPNNEGFSYMFKNYGFESNSDIIRGIPFSANKVLGPIGSFAIQLTVNGLFNSPVQYLFTNTWWNEQYNYYH